MSRPFSLLSYYTTQDGRKAIHKKLKERADEYHRKQLEIIAQTRTIRREKEDAFSGGNMIIANDDSHEDNRVDLFLETKERGATEYFDAAESK